MKLTPKQERFCQEYIIDLNATQAAIRAGYSAKTAYSSGQRLLKNVEIQNKLSDVNQKRQNTTEITANRVLEEYAKIAFFNIKSIFGEGNTIKPIDELPDEVTAAISSIEITEEYNFETKLFTGYNKKIKPNDKLRALEALGKHLGVFEKDNSQKGQGVNVNALSDDVLKALIDASR